MSSKKEDLLHKFEELQECYKTAHVYPDDSAEIEYNCKKPELDDECEQALESDRYNNILGACYETETQRKRRLAIERSSRY